MTQDPSGPELDDLAHAKAKHRAKRDRPVSDGEARNGWDEASLQQYLNERDRAVSRIHRLGVHVDDKPPTRIITSDDHDPHNW